MRGEPETLRCSGCGARWTSPEGFILAGVVHLCGDCWRKAQPILHASPAAHADIAQAVPPPDHREAPLDVPLDAIRDAAKLAASERNHWQGVHNKTSEHWESVRVQLEGFALATEVRAENGRASSLRMTELSRALDEAVAATKPMRDKALEAEQSPPMDFRLRASSPAAHAERPLTHRLNLMAIRRCVDEGFAEWAQRSGFVVPNGFAGSAAAKVWQFVQAEVRAALSERPTP
jgi:hypothetical protein